MTDVEDIDYKALYESVVGELEQARITIMKMRYARNPLDRLDFDKVRAFLQKNYLLIVLAFLAVEFMYKLILSIRSNHDG